jgi:hypothetical protein
LQRDWPSTRLTSMASQCRHLTAIPEEKAEAQHREFPAFVDRSLFGQAPQSAPV